jgi:hypothetical protein
VLRWPTVLHMDLVALVVLGDGSLNMWATYCYSAPNRMRLFLKLFILVKRSTYFWRSFCPSSGAQNCTYGNRHMSNSCCCLLLVDARQVAAAIWHMPVAICAVLSSWWWTERPSKTCTVFYKNK